MDNITRKSLKLKDLCTNLPRYKNDQVSLFIGQNGDYDIYFKKTSKGIAVCFRYGNKQSEQYVAYAQDVTQNMLDVADVQASIRRAERDKCHEG